MITSTFRFIAVEATIETWTGNVTVDDFEVVVTNSDITNAFGELIPVVLNRSEVSEFSTEYWTECDRQAAEWYIENRADHSYRRDCITFT